MVTSILGSPLPMQETEIEFLAPGFSVTQSWPLWAFWKISESKILVLSLSSLSLSFLPFRTIFRMLIPE